MHRKNLRGLLTSCYPQESWLENLVTLVAHKNEHGSNM